jgi:hypothetical protein
VTATPEIERDGKPSAAAASTVICEGDNLIMTVTLLFL